MNKAIRIMKLVIIIAIILVIANPIVYANNVIYYADFSVLLTAPSKVLRGETIEVMLTLDRFADVGEGINSFLADLEYDKTKLSIESSQIVAQNGWDTPEYGNDRILTTKGSMVKQNTLTL